MKRTLAALCFLLFAALVYAQTSSITSCGSYGAGNYALGNSLTVSSGDCLVLTGNVTLDLSDKEIKSTATGNAWDYGIQHSGGALLLSRTGGTCNVTGFRAGVRTSGAGSILTGINFCNNRYFAAWIEGDNSKVTGGTISDIGGVTDEAYAIGVQVSDADNVEVSGVTFKNIYRQSGGPGSFGDGQGEGLAVNFAASSTNGKLLNSTYENDEFQRDTIGVFLGSGGGHAVDGFVVHNIFKPAQRADVNNSEIYSVTATISTGTPPPPPGEGAKWNSAQSGTNLTYADGDLSIVQVGNETGGSAIGTVGKSSGKYYFELTYTTPISLTASLVGVTKGSYNIITSLSSTDADDFWYDSEGRLNTNGSPAEATGKTSWAGSGDTVGVAVDCDTGKIWFKDKNGAWLTAANDAAVAAGNNADFTGGSGTYYPIAGLMGGAETGNKVTANFDGPFAHSVPSGFLTFAE
jgi:hypothetical protein